MAKKRKKAARKKYTKKNGVNRSEEIRKYFEAHPGVGNAEVKKALGARGIDVSSALVGNVKARDVIGKPSGKKGRRKGRRASTRPLDDVRHAGDLFFEAVQLVVKAGAKEAKQLVGMAEELVNTVRDRK